MIDRLRVALVIVIAAGCGTASGPPVVETAPGAVERQPGFETVAQFPAEWPRWRGPAMDGIAHEKMPAAFPEKGPATLWSFSPGAGFSAPSIASGRLVILGREAENEIVSALEATSGRLLWQTRYPARYAGIGYANGPRSTPTIDGDHVYTLGATGIVHCLDLVSGDIVWRLDLRTLGDRNPPSYGYVHSLLIRGNLLFLEPGGKDGKSLAAVDKLSGEIVWMDHSEALGHSSPIAIKTGGEELIAFLTGSALLGVEPATGALRFRHPFQTDNGLNVASPIFSNDSLFISASYGKGGALVQLNGTDKPDLVWENKVMKNHFSTSVLVDGYVYGYSDTILTCMELSSGQRKWATRDVARGTVMVANDTLLALSEDGELVTAPVSPDGFETKTRTKLFDTDKRTWTVPVLAGGRLFVRDETTLKAFDLEANAR